jgi:hypothetical protein
MVTVRAPERRSRPPAVRVDKRQIAHTIERGEETWRVMLAEEVRLQAGEALVLA